MIAREPSNLASDDRLRKSLLSNLRTTLKGHCNMARIYQELLKARSRLKAWGIRRFVRNIFGIASFIVANWFWDLRNGVDTRQRLGVLDLEIEGVPGSEHAEGYTSSTPALLERLKPFDLDWSSFTFVDLGCGQGKALLLAAQLPFSKAIGVEISSKLVGVARRNLSTYRGTRLKCRNIEVLEENAAEYVYPETPLVIYCFNPFSSTVLIASLARLKASLENNFRPVYFLYVNPVWKDAVTGCGFLSLLREEEGYQLYGAMNAEEHRAGRAADELATITI